MIQQNWQSSTLDDPSLVSVQIVIEDTGEISLTAKETFERHSYIRRKFYDSPFVFKHYFMPKIKES